MEEQEFGAVRNRDRENVRDSYNEFMKLAENAEIKAIHLIDGTEFFIHNASSSITLKDGKVKNAKSILQAVSSIFDDKILELKGATLAVENSINNLVDLRDGLEKYQMNSKLSELNELVETLSTYIPKLKSLNEPVESSRVKAIEKMKKKIVHLHKNEFINRLK